MDQQTKVIATAFAFAGFAVALLAGLASGSPAAEVILRALVALLLCHAIGWGAATIFARAAETGLAEYERTRPIPSLEFDVVEVGEEVPTVELATGSGDEKFSQNLSEKGFG